MTEHIRYIDTREALVALCQQLETSPWLALDTEFLREKTYYPKLCLIQLANNEFQACVDPLTIDDLTPLLDLIYQPRITKVFHAARQDLEIFHHLRGEVPGPVFDTQLAAPLLGHAEQIGYGKLVEAELGIRLDKNHARADWTRRPLPRAQLRYALDDVVYLARLYPRMRDALARKQRLAWLEQEFNQLLRAENYTNPPEQAWRRIRNAHRLKPSQLGVLKTLAAWRERRAQASDRPRNWLCRDDALIDLARLQPDSLAELGHIRGLPEKLLQREGETLLELIRQGKQIEVETDNDTHRPQKLALAQQAVVDVLMALINLRAEEQGISPTSLAGRKEVEKLVVGDGDSKLLHGWRRAMIGEDLLAMLQGRRSLHMEQGRLRICETPGGKD